MKKIKIPSLILILLLCSASLCFAEESNTNNIFILTGILTGVWTLLGIIIGSYLTYLNTTRINRKERQISVRKEVYLKASEDFVKASQYLGTLAQLDISKNNLANGFHDLFISASKVSLIAEQKTVKSVSDLVLCYNKLLFKFTPTILDFNLINNKIKINKDFYNKTQIEIDRILHEMRKYRENLENNSQRFQALDNSYKFQEERANKLSDEINELWATYNKQNTIFAKELIEELKNIHPLQTIVLCNMREELEIDTNFDNFKEIFENHSRISIEETNKTIKVLSEYIATKKF